jgi:hypothetical protein
MKRPIGECPANTPLCDPLTDPSKPLISQTLSISGEAKLSEPQASPVLVQQPSKNKRKKATISVEMPG